MFTFDKITQTNGFDTDCKKNAIQNSYASAITELDSYIYVGTVRNALTMFEYSKDCDLNIPPWILKGKDNNAEIWRYKKDGSCPWERVFKADCKDHIRGFSSIITHKYNNTKEIYAAGISNQIYLLKSTDGIHWVRINTSYILGTSAKCLLSFKGALYMSTIKIGFNKNAPYLYESKNPDCIKFKPVIDTEDIYFDQDKNPVGRIENINCFNNRIYVGISTTKGCELWRSYNDTPCTNKWIQIGKEGFFDKANTNIIASTVFKDYLYVSCSKRLPLSLFVPLGFDLVRVDKKDNIELVMGGPPLISTDECKSDNTKSLSGFNSGFNSYFNVYGWQLKSYSNTLFVTTYDASTNMVLIRDSIIYNSESLINSIGYENYNTLLKSYTDICNLLTCYYYPKGFDMYISSDGQHFIPMILNGLNDPDNYGGKSLYKSCDGLLYLGTANPYQGCELWKINKDNYIIDCQNDDILMYYKNLKEINCKLLKIYPYLIKILSSIKCI